MFDKLFYGKVCGTVLISLVVVVPGRVLADDLADLMNRVGMSATFDTHSFVYNGREVKDTNSIIDNINAITDVLHNTESKVLSIVNNVSQELGTEGSENRYVSEKAVVDALDTNLTSAKSYTDDLANGAVKSNTDAIAVLTGGTALAAGTNGSNLVAATNTLSSLVNHNGTDAIIHRDFQTESMTVDAGKSIVENINVISAELQNAESRVKVLEDNMIGADTSAIFTNKTIDADVNTITNLEVDNFKDGVVSQSIGTTGSENKLVSEKAVRDAINERTTMGSTAGSNYAASATVVQAIETIDQNMGKIDGLVTAQTATTTSSGLAYNGNLAHGSATVEHHLSSLDASIGDMRGFATENNYATDTESVAANLVALDGQLKTTTDAVDTLANGDENTVGSVRNIAKSYFDLAAQSDALTLSAANAYTDKRIEKLDQDLSAGIASAVALSSVAVSDVRRGELSVGAGYGYFNGQSAGAFGAAMGISNRWSVNAGAGISGYDVSFRAGTNYKFKLF